MASRVFGQDLRVGLELGHYRIVEKIGSGGMGDVYRAHDEHLDREVAIKVLPAGSLSDESSRKRFRKEALTLSKLNHPNIATVHDFDTQEGVDFLVMEYIPGITLSEKVAAGPLPEKDVVRLGMQLAEGLSAAHEHGVVHRDLKPGNLRLTTEERLKILDFGLAKLRLPVTASAVTESMSETHVVAGTLPYMAPEQLLGGDIDARTDIHAAGSVLYEMATGQRPFAEVERSQLISGILSTPPRPPTTLNHKLSSELERIIGKCLEKEPENRYQSAKELAVDLRRLRGTTPAVAQSKAFALKRGYSWIVVAALVTILATVTTVRVVRRHRFAPLTDKDTVLVADFTNTTGDSVFDDALRQGLLAQLRQSPFLGILPDNRVRAALRQMRREPQELLKDEVARELCQRTQSTAFVSGSIASVGSEYILALKAVNCATGDILWQQQKQVRRKEEILESLDAQATLLRQGLGESLASTERFAVPLFQVTTPSLEALQAFTLGQNKLNEGAFLEAIPHLKRAVELDPNFALAYGRLGSAYRNLDESGFAEEYTQKAFALRERVTEFERAQLEGTFYDRVTGEYDKEIAVWEAYKSAYPKSIVPYIGLNNVYSDQGEYEKCVAEGRGTLQRWKGAIAYVNLTDCLIRSGKLDEAQKVLNEASASGIKSSVLHQFSYEIAFLRGDAAEMRRLVALAPDAQLILLEQWRTEMYYGRVRRGREFLRRTVEDVRKNHLLETASAYLARSAVREADFGNFTEARRLATESLGAAKVKDSMIAAAIAYARSGNLDKANALTDGLAKKYPNNTLLNQAALPTIRALIEMKKNNARRAVGLLQNVSFFELCRNWGVLEPIYTRGQAYILLGRGQEAAADFQTVLSHPELVRNDPKGALAHLWLARAEVLKRDTAKAREEYEQFLNLWKDADRELPVYLQAKAEYAKLQ